MTEGIEIDSNMVDNDLDGNHVQTTGLTRNPIDKYYTKESVVELCVSHIKRHLKIKKLSDIIVEPSAGGGVFYIELVKLCKNIHMFDIKPENVRVIQKNFLEVSTNDICPETPSDKIIIHTVGNPPFGRQSSLAIKFIKHASTFSKTISFILPKSFKKDSMRRAFPLSFHLLFECDLPENSFTVNGKEHNSPCIFQIWERRPQPRKVKIPPEPIGYVFVKKEKGAMVSLRRVGVFAGKVDADVLNKSEQSHYFVKFVDDTLVSNIGSIIDSMNGVEYEFNNTVGPKSISKPEFTKELNKIIELCTNKL